MNRKNFKRNLGLGVLSLGVLALSPDVIAAKRVVGGAEIDISTAPYQVAIGLAGFDTFDGQFCGGTIIDEKWILTAAHCFLNDDEPPVVASSGNLIITVGEATLSTASAANQYAFTVQDNVYVHPGFTVTDTVIDYDIALIQLPSPIDLEACGADCSAISYANPDNESVLAPLSAQAWSSGWGATSQNVPVLINGIFEDPANYSANPADTLKEVELRIVSCDASLTGVTRTERVICAGAIDMNQEDTCQGDSGGPLVVQNNEGTGFTLVGVNSYGHGCAAGEEGAYTRVSKFADWIATRLANPAISPSEASAEPVDTSGEQSDMSGEGGGSSNATILRSDGGGSVGFLLMLSLAALAVFRRSNR